MDDAGFKGQAFVKDGGTIYVKDVTGTTVYANADVNGVIENSTLVNTAIFGYRDPSGKHTRTGAFTLTATDSVFSGAAFAGRGASNDNNITFDLTNQDDPYDSDKDVTYDVTLTGGSNTGTMAVVQNGAVKYSYIEGRWPHPKK